MGSGSFQERASVRRSPSGTKGIWFVRGDREDEEWQVGERYVLVKRLGSGSFSSVCLATDGGGTDKVAVKRIPDVLSSPEQAKRVLREICILRRLDHPNIISLRDAFVRPSVTGPRKLVRGQLVAKSIDIYLVMEYADGGDLFHLKGQLPQEDVRLLMWQMLHALKYLHSQDVWHRDLKSSNVLLTYEHGHRIVKIADMGSARSANREGYHWVEQKAPSQADAVPAMPAVGGRSAPGRALHHSNSFQGTTGEQVHMSDLYVQTGEAAGRGPRGLLSPLTRMVATPCYRAPEVVMSRGGYTSSIDMWSLGCIFGELLQRVAHVGSAATPQLQVPPLFAIHGMPRTPCEGERYTGGPGCSTTRKEIHALFDVIGTPTWADVDHVQSDAWRSYLQRRAATLYRRLGAAGEPAVHLLACMLTFDPARRCSSEEALAHEYFAGLEPWEDETADGSQSMEEDVQSVAVSVDRMDLDREPSDPLQQQPQQQQQQRSPGLELESVKSLRQMGIGTQKPPKRARNGEKVDGGAALPLPVPAELERLGSAEAGYYQEADPATALAMLEEELACDDIPRLRELLEREVDAQNVHSRSREAGRPQRRSHSHSPHRHHLLPKLPKQQRQRRNSLGEIESWEGLQEDVNALASTRDPALYGPERLSNVADTMDGKLNTEEFLKQGRHGGWTTTSGQGPPAGPTWGVNIMPPGMEQAALNPDMLKVIRDQQLR